jgi:hypothetical protein
MSDVLRADGVAIATALWHSNLDNNIDICYVKGINSSDTNDINVISSINKLGFMGVCVRLELTKS